MLQKRGSNLSEIVIVCLNQLGDPTWWNSSVAKVQFSSQLCECTMIDSFKNAVHNNKKKYSITKLSSVVKRLNFQKTEKLWYLPEYKTKGQ